MSDLDPLRPHRHDPNPEPPGQDASFRVLLGERQLDHFQPARLRHLPRSTVTNVRIVSTGHGTSGPFTFGGVALRDLVVAVVGLETNWSQVEVVSGDGFGTRIAAEELAPDPEAHVILLGDEIDGRSLTRAQGLVRLVVPSERDDALRQVKWVREIRIIP
jgi:hypothetical protein